MQRPLLILLTGMMALSSSHAQALRVELGGEWLFAADSLRKGVEQGWFREGHDRSQWQTVRVPAFWESYPAMAGYDGWGWFARTMRIGTSSVPLSLFFSGADDDAVVWVNGVEVGSHAGYTDPFAVDITSAVREGDNTVVVLVKDYGGGGGIYKPVTLIESRAIDELLRSVWYGTPARPSAEWVKDAVIYSVYLRSFSAEGNFRGLQQRVPELKALGATVLWLLPINPVGLKNRKGVLGSPYAVQDYYAINPEFGTMEEFKSLLRTVHDHGMRLIIDMVANHTSWDSKLLAEHPEWFTHDSTGRIVAPNDDWTDVADLDYSHPGLRRYMTDMMVWWVREVGIDGFRCDVAELVPTDFWNEVRTALDAVRPVMMLSEGSLPEHHAHAFDLTYSWNVYDALSPLLQGVRPVTLLDQILKNERLQFPEGSLRMRFTTNHDKNAWDAPAVEKFGPDGLKLATVLVTTIPGVPMIYNGEEVANDKRLSLFERVPIAWDRPHWEGDLYRALFTLRREHVALRRGRMVRLRSAPENEIYAFARAEGKDLVLVALNFASRPRTVEVQVDPALAGAIPDGRLHDLLAGTAVRVAGGLLSLSLPPRGFMVLAPGR